MRRREDLGITYPGAFQVAGQYLYIRANLFENNPAKALGLVGKEFALEAEFSGVKCISLRFNYLFYYRFNKKSEGWPVFFFINYFHTE